MLILNKVSSGSFASQSSLDSRKIQFYFDYDFVKNTATIKQFAMDGFLIKLIGTEYAVDVRWECDDVDECEIWNKYLFLNYKDVHILINHWRCI